MLERASAAGHPKFLARDVALPAGAAVRIVADWDSLDEVPVLLEIDLGNDGVFDDSLALVNQFPGPSSDVQESEVGPMDIGLTITGTGGPRLGLRASVPRPGPVTMRVYDSAGRQVASIAEDQPVRDLLNVDWRGVDSRGNQLGSGVYFVRMVCRPSDGGPMRSTTQRAVLVR